MADAVKAALTSLRKADLAAIKALRLVGRILQQTLSEPALVPCTFRAGGKTYRGLVTRKQRARIMDVSGSTALIMEKRLLGLLKMARLPVAELVDVLPDHAKAIGDGITPAHFRPKSAKVPDSLGRCNYVNSDGAADCVDSVLKADCDALPNGNFAVGMTCAH